MKNIKDEIQNILIRNGQASSSGKLSKVYNFLRANAQAGSESAKQKYFKNQEEALLIKFALEADLIYKPLVSEDLFISAGAEQRVYKFDEHSIIKLNSSVFYECWLDYFINLIVHNYFFISTLYEFLGFKIIQGNLFAVVKQEFILSTEITDISELKLFMEYNGFKNVRNNDYINKELGIILEDLHDENVLSKNGVLYFIDTVFYLLPNAYTLE